MSFTSPVFLAFFAVTALIYFLLPKRGQWVCLLLASYVFYLWQAPVFGLLLAGTTVLTYVLARLIAKNGRRLWLVIGAGLLFCGIADLLSVRGHCAVFLHCSLHLTRPRSGAGKADRRSECAPVRTGAGLDGCGRADRHRPHDGLV